VGDTWELDFYSRPMLDEAGKKIWELLLCSEQTGFEYVAQCAQKDANRLWLTNQLELALTLAPVPPERVRFFRLIMAGIVEGACKQLDLPCRLSWRVFRLRQWLEARETTVYAQLPGYQANLSSRPTKEIVTPQPIPDALMGERWAFVHLPAQEFATMEPLRFGERVKFDLPPDTLVPGLVVFSGRALAMAAWMQGAEPVALSFADGRLLLEAGAGEEWIMIRTKDAQIGLEGQRFETRKVDSLGYHFLAIQPSPESEEPTGFWTLWIVP